MKDYRESYIFPAIFEKSPTGYGVSFPDLPGCISMGKDLQNAYEMAKEALGLHLWSMESDEDDIPEPSAIDTIELEKGETIALIEIWMIPVRAEMDNRSVKKTLTIPHYLNKLGESKKVNFSQLLQSALKNHLGIQK